MSRKSLHPPLSRADQKKRSQDRLINLLLSAIVQAYPYHSPNVKDETRIARAKEALFGERIPRGQKSIRDDLKLFPIYAEALRQEIGALGNPVRQQKASTKNDQHEYRSAPDGKSDAEIAREFSSEVEPRVRVPESTDRWLRKVISEFSLTGQDMADLEGLLAGDSPKALRLRRILTDLEEIGVLSKTPVRTENGDLSPETD